MKTFKGTPGSWNFYEIPDYFTPEASRHEVASEIKDSVWICKVQTNGVIQKEEGLANAKLIAAAPELLEALQEIMRFKSELAYVMGKELASPKNFLSALSVAEKALNKAL